MNTKKNILAYISIFYHCSKYNEHKTKRSALISIGNVCQVSTFNVKKYEGFMLYAKMFCLHHLLNVDRQFLCELSSLCITKLSDETFKVNKLIQELI